MRDKLHVFVFAVFFTLFPASLVAQGVKINIKGDNITIKQAFEQLEAQSALSVAYNQTKFDVSRRITMEIYNKSLNEALDIILKDSGWTYILNGKHIIIVLKAGDQVGEEPGLPRQNIRGIVTDGASGLPVPFAYVFILNKSGIMAVADTAGKFCLPGLPVGRYDLQASFMGYETTTFREIMLTSAKEVYLEIPLKEKVYYLDEIVVSNRLNKEKTINPTATAGARMFSTEEASRYAGGFDDPARLVTSFAGVSGGIADNSVSIHGNAPQLLQWRLEDIEIPNPNHFADLTTMGGGVFTALSSQVLGNSDFFTGAFPAEYGNALSGVFDMKLRNGNNQRHENTFQVGLIGIDVASEGPTGKRNQASYLFNYRYSTLALVKQMIPNFDVTNLAYQDLSFKLNFPTAKAGTFSLWGIGLADKSNDKIENSSLSWGYERQVDITGSQYMGAGGVGHKYFFKNGASLKTTAGVTFSNNDLQTDSMYADARIAPNLNLQNRAWNLILASSFNHKFSSKHTNKTGFYGTTYFYNFDFSRDNIITPSQQAMESGTTFLISLYSNSTVDLNKYLSANIGLNTQLFMLNGNRTIEPRLGLNWNFTPNHSFALAYGLHSKMERLATYFIRPEDYGSELVNHDLDFVKSHQWVLSYNWKVSENTHFKIEPYYQYLTDVPAVSNSIFSTLNGLSFFVNVPLANEGKGRNMGVDLTFERYLADGFYYMLTGSVFDSKYSVDDVKWYNTRYNTRYLFNALGGKEWMLGKYNQNVLSVNLKLTYKGGERYTPIDEKKSIETSSVAYYEDKAFEAQFPAKFIANFSTSYKINRSKLSHEFALKILNLTGTPEFDKHFFNLTTYAVETNNTRLILPNISYRIGF